MNAIQNKSCGFWRGILAVAAGLVVALPLSTARADDDDDWEDDWEDYQEELEEEREEARERWEEWHEDREEALEEWREHGRHRYYAPYREYRSYGYRQPRYYDYHSGPVYERNYMEAPRYYQYEPAPRYRYYGTPDVGYTEFGRQRSIQIGGLRVYWDRH